VFLTFCVIFRCDELEKKYPPILYLGKYDTCQYLTSCTDDVKCPAYVSRTRAWTEFSSYMYLWWGTWLCGWLRHCATSWKVAGSIPDSVGIFHWLNPSGHTMALGLTQPRTEMSTRNISWGWRRPVRRADNLTTFMCWLCWNLGASTSWNPQGLSRPVMGLLYLIYL